VPASLILTVKRSRRLPLLAAIFLLALPFLAGCIPAARHREALAELERLRRENLDLRRDLAEQRVRLEETMEAAGSLPAGAAGRSRAPASPQGQALEQGAGATVGAGGSPPVPGGFRDPEGGEIEEEEIRDPSAPPGAAPEEGDRTLWVARRYREEGRMAEAIEAYGSFIRDYPFSPLLPEAFMERGGARLAAGDRRGALEDLRTVVEAFPGSPLAGEARKEVARLETP